MHRGLEGEVRSSNSSDWYASLQPWLDVFDEVVILARVDLSSRVSTGRRVEGPRVRVVAVPFYEGAQGLLLRGLSVRSAILSACSDPNAFYGGRLPGVVAGFVLTAARRLRAPFLASVVGDPRAVLDSGVAGLVGKALAPLAGAAMRYQVRNSTAAIYVSKSYLQDRYPPSEEMQVLSQSNVNFSPDALVTNAPHSSVDSKTKVIIAVGTHDQMYKGHDLLIRAITILEARGLGVRLELVGGGRMQPELRALARRLGVHGKVRFHGHVQEPEEVRQLLDRADLFLMPSRTEGVPRALIEAMARGKPCLGSDVGGIPELLDSDAIFPRDNLDIMADLIFERLRDPQWLDRQAQVNLDRARHLADTSKATEHQLFLKEFIARGHL